MATPNFADKTIWTGDNLDIMRGMNSESVDLIYLDPPFNSNQDYAAPVGSALDHRVPRSRGGTDHLDNLQLLCSSCNRIKGDRPQEFLMARLAELTR